MMMTETQLGSREHTPATDVNFNSPGHHSSVDGSFIQDDENEMHLILDFESEGGRMGKGGIINPSHLYQPTSVLTSSWISRQTQWATDFDANIAELDFDNVDTTEILHIQQQPKMYSNPNANYNDDITTNQHQHYDYSTWPTNLKLQHHLAGEHWNLEQDNYHRAVGQRPLQGSLDLSISHSDSLLSSSDPIDAFGGIVADLAESMVQATSILIPEPEDLGESLHLSKVVAEGEQLIAQCMTRPRDYVLTWEAVSKIAESISASSLAAKESNQSVDFYMDAHLSNASEPLDLSSKNRLSVIAWPENSKAPTLCTSDHVMTTWGAVKQANKQDTAANNSTPKSHSLPDLNPQPFHQMLMQCSGAGEHMLSMEAKLPLYDLMTSSTSQGWPSPPNSRLSLLQVFQQKLNISEKGSPLPVDPVQSPTSPFQLIQEREEERKCQADNTAAVLQNNSTSNNQDPTYRPDTVHIDDHDYAEFYVRGRYIDVNHNEIGYVPPSTEGIQSVAAATNATTWRQQRRNSVMSESVSDAETAAAVTNDRWNLLQPNVAAGPIKPPRTFATLLDNKGHNSAAGSEDKRRHSATQLPVYMVEQSVQTHESDEESTLTVGPFVPTVVMTRSSETPPTYVSSSQILKDLTSNPLPPLKFLEFPFDVPSLFPHAPPFPVDFLESSIPTTTKSDKHDDDEQENGSEIWSTSPWQVPNYGALIAGRAGAQQNEKAASANLGVRTTKSNKPILARPLSEDRLSAHAKCNSSTNAVASAMFSGGLLQDQDTHHNLLLPPYCPSSSAAKSGPAGLPKLSGLVADMTLPPGLTRPADRDQQCCSPSPSTSASSKLASTRDRDSGLGGSGPTHIRDWESLAVLLPKNVVQACSFFNNEKLSPRGAGSIDKPGPSQSQYKQHRARRLMRHRDDYTNNMQHHQTHCATRRRPCSEPLFDRPTCGMGRFESIREEDGGETCTPRDPYCPQRHYRETMGCHGSACSQPYYPIWCHSLPSYCGGHPPVHCHNCCVCPCRQSKCCRSSPLPDSVYGAPLKRHRSNLQKWRAPYCHSDSDESDSASDCAPQNPRDSAPLLRHRLPLHSISSDSDEANDYAEYGSSMMVRSECARSRPAAAPRRVLSMQNMKDDPRMFSSFLRPNNRSSSDVAHEHKPKCASRACATCYRVRSPSVERVPEWANPPQMQDPVWRQWFCDCRTSDILEELEQDERRRRRNRCLVTFLDGLKAATMSEEETSLLNTPVYQQKKDLVQNIIGLCETISETFVKLKDAENKDKGTLIKLVKSDLCPAIKQLLGDGMKQESTVWMLITESATPGPATKSIHELVSDLTEKTQDNEYQWLAFMNGLLCMNSIDCWLSYLALKDRLLTQHYQDAAFMRRATSAYRSLFTRLLIGVQQLGLHNFDDLCLLTYNTPPSTPKRYSLLPTRLPSDSRVPKSSSVPSRLSPPRASKSRSVDSGLARLRRVGGVGTASPTRIPLPVSKSNATGWRHQYVEDGEVVLCLY